MLCINNSSQALFNRAKQSALDELVISRIFSEHSISEPFYSNLWLEQEVTKNKVNTSLNYLIRIKKNRASSF